jgi:hypothetical protein
MENRVLLLTTSIRSRSIGGDVGGAAIGVLSTDQISPYDFYLDLRT